MLAAHLDLQQPLYFVVENFFSSAACDDLRQQFDAVTSWEMQAPITTHNGPSLRADTRNNERLMFDSVELAQTLFAQLQPHVPPLLLRKRLVGLNERFRVYRYRVGQRFKAHYDGSFHRDPEGNERSLLTFLLYLNDDFTGGATRFLDLSLDIQPQKGAALLFQHPLLHEGCEVLSGCKYVLRSDVMYQRI